MRLAMDRKSVNAHPSLGWPRSVVYSAIFFAGAEIWTVISWLSDTHNRWGATIG